MGRGPDRTPRRPRRHHAADQSGLPDWVFAIQRWGQGVPYAYDVWLEPTWNDDAGHWQGIVATLHVVGTDVYVDPVVVVDMRSERAKRRSKNRRVMADLSLPLRAHITNPDLPTRIQQLCKPNTTAPASTSPSPLRSSVTGATRADTGPTPSCSTRFPRRQHTSN